jgi:hypothetical protein
VVENAVRIVPTASAAVSSARDRASRPPLLPAALSPKVLGPQERASDRWKSPARIAVGSAARRKVNDQTTAGSSVAKESPAATSRSQ